MVGLDDDNHDPAGYQIHGYTVPGSSSKKDPHVVSIPEYYTLLCPLRSGCTRRSAMWWDQIMT